LTKQHGRGIGQGHPAPAARVLGQAVDEQGQLQRLDHRDVGRQQQVRDREHDQGHPGRPDAPRDGESGQAPGRQEGAQSVSARKAAGVSPKRPYQARLTSSGTRP
jgi:hypothetical protein